MGQEAHAKTSKKAKKDEEVRNVRSRRLQQGESHSSIMNHGTLYWYRAHTVGVGSSEVRYLSGRIRAKEHHWNETIVYLRRRGDLRAADLNA